MSKNHYQMEIRLVVMLTAKQNALTTLLLFVVHACVLYVSTRCGDQIPVCAHLLETTAAAAQQKINDENFMKVHQTNNLFGYLFVSV